MILGTPSLNLYDVFSLLYYFVFASLLIIAFVYDFKHKLIPDFTSYGIFALAVIRLFVSVVVGGGLLVVGYDLIAAFAVAAIFGGIWFFSKEKAMGFGDVKLAPAITLFLGFSKGILAILLSFWLGSIVGLILIILAKVPPLQFAKVEPLRAWTLKSEIPFGPFLVLGALIALLWGEKIIEAYLQFLAY